MGHPFFLVCRACSIARGNVPSRPAAIFVKVLLPLVRFAPVRLSPRDTAVVQLAPRRSGSTAQHYSNGVLSEAHQKFADIISR